jgi:PhzF family phenazine biosynthesis protein
MKIERIAAFALGDMGGNPAGVVIEDQLPPRDEMQKIAKEVGFSETAFAAPEAGGWQVRYFAPESEVPFCGHATIALGCALGQRFGAGLYVLNLARAQISVSAQLQAGGWQATLRSPPTWSRALPATLLDELLLHFGLRESDLDPAIPPRVAHGGATHAILALNSRAKLAAMSYDFSAVQDLMRREGFDATISLIFRESADVFFSRNAFAIGGVVEDPATGAAAAALGGMLVDLGRGAGSFTIRQGEDMGMPSLLQVSVTGVAGDPVQVSGGARWL